MKRAQLSQSLSYLFCLEDTTGQNDVQPIQLHAFANEDMIWIGTLKTLFWTISAIAVSILAASLLN